MKNAIIGLIVVVLGLLTIVAFSKMSSTSTRDTELSTCVSEAVKNTMDGTSEFHSDAEMAQDFERNLKAGMNSKGKIKIIYYGVDYQKGLLDVEVVQTYQMDGKTKTMKCRKTSVLEEKER